MSEPEPGFPEGARSPGSAHGHAPAPACCSRLQPQARSSPDSRWWFLPSEDPNAGEGLTSYRTVSGGQASWQLPWAHPSVWVSAPTSGVIASHTPS